MYCVPLLQSADYEALGRGRVAQFSFVLCASEFSCVATRLCKLKSSQRQSFACILPKSIAKCNLSGGFQTESMTKKCILFF